MKNEINPHTEYYISIIILAAVFFLMGSIVGLMFGC
jgi:hypothetical protein